MLQIREAVRHEYRAEVRKELISIDDHLFAARVKFEETLSSDSLTELVSAWSRAVYLLGLAMGPADPEATGGRMVVAA